MRECGHQDLVVCINEVLHIASDTRWRLNDLDDFYLYFYCRYCGARYPMPRGWQYSPLAWQHIAETNMPRPALVPVLVFPRPADLLW